MIKKMLKILLFITIFLPFSVMAQDEGISNYYIEANVKNNGDLLVKELFVLEGNFNGYERIINYKNPFAEKFDGSIESFKGSDIYNGSHIELSSIKAIEIDEDVNFDYLYNDGDEFIYDTTASNGAYGQYTVIQDIDGIKYRIYNPSSSGKRGFYIEYVIKNIGISHNDIAEIGWNIFSNQQNENIENLEMTINIPNNKELLRVWGHGPLTGETEIINKNKLLYKINDLYSNTPIDVRFVFDKGVLLESLKNTETDAFDKILEVENTWAEEANIIREEARKQETNKEIISYISDALKIIWLGILVYIVYDVYHKHDKEYQTTFKTKYFRDFPNNYGPANVGYLFNKKIGTKEISATILDLIVRKHIKYEKFTKKEYQLIYIPDSGVDELTKAEESLIKMLFEVVGNENKVTIDQINNYAKKNYQSFLNSYNDWKDIATTEAEDRNFYEEKGTVKLKAMTFSIVGLLLTIVFSEYSMYPIINIIVIMLSFVSLVYFATITKRTVDGQVQYSKWRGLDSFIKDFGKFKTRELPQINLWEKYLVYAVVFGTAKKLSKDMEIKFAELPQNTYTTGDFIFDTTYLRMINNLNYSIDRGVTNAVNTALSTKAISESKNSSSGGFGGGFSGGGGSFGGGGGGGRF